MSGDFRVGQTIPELRVGDQVIQNVQVTEQNKHIVADGDIDAADIERLRGNDGDRSNVTKADFAAFDPAGTLFQRAERGLARVVAGMSTTTTVRPPEGNVPTVADLTLSARTFTEAAAARVANPSPELRAAHATVADLPGSRITVNKAAYNPGSTGADGFRTALQALPPQQRQEVTQALIHIATHDPGMTLRRALSILENVGIPRDQAGAMVQAGRLEVMGEINAQAQQMFALEGGGTPVASYLLATGDGSGTTPPVPGGQGLVAYSGDVAYADRGVRDARTATMTVPVADPNQPMSMHLHASGLNGGGADLTVNYGGQDYQLSISGSGIGRISGDLPPGATLTAVPPEDGGGYMLSFANPPGDQPVTITQQSRLLRGKSERSQDPWDEVFLRVTATNVQTPTITSEPPPSLERTLPPPPPATDGVGGFAPNRMQLLPGSEVDNNITEMAAYVAANPEVLEGLTVSLQSHGAVHNGQRVPEISGQTYGQARLGGEVLTQANTAQDRRASFELQIQDGSLVIQGEASADPFRATIQGVDRGDLAGFMRQHPQLTENDALGALRQFALLEAFQGRLNEQLQGQGRDPVDLLSNAEVRLADDTTMSYQQFLQIKQ